MGGGGGGREGSESLISRTEEAGKEVDDGAFAARVAKASVTVQN